MSAGNSITNAQDMQEYTTIYNRHMYVHQAEINKQQKYLFIYQMHKIQLKAYKRLVGWSLNSAFGTIQVILRL